MTASGWFCSVRIFIFHSLSLICGGKRKGKGKKKGFAREPKVGFTCWGQMSLWSQFPGFQARSWERLSWCYCKLNELDWSGLILLFSNLSLLCFIATMYRRFFRSLHAFLWCSQWLAFDSCPWLGDLFVVGMVLSACSFGSALIVLFSLRFSWRFDLCALMPYLSVVYYCAFWAVSIALWRNYVFWPLLAEFCLWFLGCILCCAGFCVSAFMNRLDGLDSTGVLQVSWVPEVGIVTNQHFRELQSYGRWCLLYSSKYWAVLYSCCWWRWWWWRWWCIGAVFCQWFRLCQSDRGGSPGPSRCSAFQLSMINWQLQSMSASWYGLHCQ